MYIPDNYDLFVQHDAEQEEALEKLPVCDCCTDKIQDEYYFDIDGEILCEKCMNKKYRKVVEV